MLVHLHVGLDKAGSTAIQYHMQHNLEWYAQRGIFIPDVGFSVVGHQVLFREMFPHKLDSLKLSLEEARGNGFEQCFLSYEGMYHLSRRELKILKNLFPRSQFLIYVYLREQSELIQSGYLQQVKTGTELFDIAHARSSDAFLFQTLLNFSELLDKLARVFGKQSIRARVYDRSLLVDGDIVRDMLNNMGLEPDAEFIFGRPLANISLDVPAAMLMNELDLESNPDTATRQALVDILLNDIAANGALERYFLTQNESAKVKSYFEKSNLATAKAYFPGDWPYPRLFPHKRQVHTDLTFSQLGESVEYKRALIKSTAEYVSWDGKPLEGERVGILARPNLGWTAGSDEGIRLQVSRGVVLFRILWKHVQPHHSGIRLALKCAYPAVLFDARLQVNNRPHEKLKNGTTVVVIPFTELCEFRRVRLSIFCEPSQDTRTLENAIFLLNSIRFRLIDIDSEQ